jgi:DNA repair protein RecO
MPMHVEGIVINKTPYKERDLICNLLLRSGRTQSIYFYGGRGGGKQNKGSILEVGFMLAIQLSPRRKKIDTDIQIAKEHKLLWDCDNIRTDYRAFYLASFYMEYISKIAIGENLNDENSTEHAGLFNVLSNGLYYLDEAVKNKNFDLNTHLFIFLSKLSIQLGVAPDLDHCLFCEKQFAEFDLCLFGPQDGGFSCMECSSKKDEYISDNKNLRQEYESSQSLRKLMKQVYHLPFKNYSQVPPIVQGVTIAEFNFINYQFGFSKDQFKSWQMISI